MLVHAYGYCVIYLIPNSKHIIEDESFIAIAFSTYTRRTIDEPEKKKKIFIMKTPSIVVNEKREKQKKIRKKDSNEFIYELRNLLYCVYCVIRSCPEVRRRSM